MIKHWDITVSGQVQGVFYRQFCLNRARQLSLTGYVVNRLDNTVYIEIEGEENKLRQFVDYCRQGSEAAKVEGLQISESETKHFTEFSIKN